MNGGQNYMRTRTYEYSNALFRYVSYWSSNLVKKQLSQTFRVVKVI